ncbi:MAG: helix-turn-helix transcriptional regulator [bacterium]
MKTSTHTSEYRSVISKLKQVREKSGLTQARVAKKLGKPQSYVSKIESGERRLDIIELKTIAKLYKKSVQDFI